MALTMLSMLGPAVRAAPAVQDANITQFYGACFTGDQMLIVSEFMEVGVV